MSNYIPDAPTFANLNITQVSRADEKEGGDGEGGKREKRRKNNITLNNNNNNNVYLLSAVPRSQTGLTALCNEIKAGHNNELSKIKMNLK